ncbi:hypothetical protein CQW23_24363 [Capsicum baccatum]|uniref:AAA-type ATPase N-terminal domain-containing protein n=1 Tax=Capsicum baccatum TaxID=33114 RepID=A0A2G2VUN8_CAPBA|nr:hypothetical protein CQW23_24363 [Capsicum baccatum]
MVTSAIPATILIVIGLVVTVIVRLPNTVNGYRNLVSEVKKICSRKVTVVIDEFDGQEKNEIYEAAVIYLGNNLSSKNRKIKASKTDKNFKVKLEHNEKVKDVYDGHKFKWVWLEFKCFDHPKNLNSIQKSEMKSFKLTFKKKHYRFVLDYYLPYIIEEAKLLKRR